MAVFSYLSVVVSIIAGLALTHLLDGVSKLIQARERVTVYWVHLVWIVGVFFLITQFWWGFWILHFVETWTYPLFVFFLLEPLFLLVIGDLAFPDFPADKPLSLRTYYYDNHRWFFLAIAGYLVLTMIELVDLRAGGRWISIANGLRLVGVLIAVTAAFTRSHRLHAVLSIVAITLLGVFVLLFNTQPLTLPVGP